jgi:hypothetical protein
MVSRGIVSWEWDLGEVSWGSSASEAYEINGSLRRRVPKPRVFSVNTTWTDVAIRRVSGL